MSIQFKVARKATKAQRASVLDALGKAGFAAEPLFGNDAPPALAAIFTITDAKDDDLERVQQALHPFGKSIEFVERAPKRFLK